LLNRQLCSSSEIRVSRTPFLLLLTHIQPYAHPNVDLEEPCNMAIILTLLDILTFFDLNLIIHRSHTFAPKWKEMAYKFWEDNIFSTHGVYSNV
jgi:hypothetical protein